MLYSTYLANEKNVPLGINKLLVVRMLPQKFDVEKHPDLQHSPSLAPSKPLLLQMKETDDWGFFKIRFQREMLQRDDLRESMERLLVRLQQGEDVCLICYEKEHTICHRSLLAKWFVDRGIRWEEL